MRGSKSRTIRISQRISQKDFEKRGASRLKREVFKSCLKTRENPTCDEIAFSPAKKCVTLCVAHFFVQGSKIRTIRISQRISQKDFEKRGASRVFISRSQKISLFFLLSPSGKVSAQPTIGDNKIKYLSKIIIPSRLLLALLVKSTLPEGESK